MKKRYHLFTTKARADAYVAKVEQQHGYPLPARKVGGDIDGARLVGTTRYARVRKNKAANRFAIPEDAGVPADNVASTKELDYDWFGDAQGDEQ